MHFIRFKQLVFSALVAVFFAAIIFLPASCHNADSPPDVSAQKISLESRRLDLDLAAIDTNNIAQGLNNLHQKYPGFFDCFIESVLSFDLHFPYSDTAEGVQKAMRSFLTYKDYRGLFDTVRTHFPDTKDIDKDISKGLQYLKYYDSSYRYNEVVYFTSGLIGWRAITCENRIGVGLDMFLGRKYPFYASVQIPDYATRNLEPKNIPVNVFKAIYKERHPFVVNDHDLLSLITQKGREQYFLKKTLPFLADTVRMEYTAAELDWCRKNEAMVYNFFVQQSMLYDKNQQKIVRYIDEGPRAAGMPEGSPGSVGVFIGSQIVDAYMKRHPEMTLNDLLKQEDEQVILQESRYNPR